jgi:hypothetical protein
VRLQWAITAEEDRDARAKSQSLDLLPLTIDSGTHGASYLERSGIS